MTPPDRSRPVPLRFEALTKSFAGRVCLGPLSMHLPWGRLVALTGSNGAGKTTLLRIAAGLEAPTEGTVEVAGAPAGSIDARREISYIADQPLLYSDLSVAEHIDFVTGLHRLPPDDPRVMSLVTTLGVTPLLDSLATALSRGQKQRLSLLLGLMRPFSILLIDEPYAPLDAAGVAAVRSILNDERERGNLVIVSAPEAERIPESTNTLHLVDGRIASHTD